MSDAPRSTDQTPVGPPSWPVASASDLSQTDTDAVAVFAWRIDRQHPAQLAQLTKNEQNRAGRFHFERDRVAFVAARFGLRWLLAQRLGVAPCDVPLEEAPGGKPFVSIDAAPAFNLSHSGGVALLALGDRGGLGVDIEAIRTDRRPPMGVAERCFTPSEREPLRQASEPQQAVLFYSLWTRKEAVVKLLGDGLQAPLQAFAVPPTQTVAETVRVPTPNRLGVEACWLQSLDAGEQFAAAIACETKPRRIVCRRLALPDA